MKNQESKAVEFIYQDSEIHFLLGNEKNVMVNATEMAKAFGKRIEDFKRLDGTKNFINALLKHENSKLAHADVRELDSKKMTESDLIQTKNGIATYYHRKLALEFATWLDVDFKVWIIDTIDELLFGNYKKHWDAHVKQEDAKTIMEETKKRLLVNPTQTDVVAYFKAENEFKSAKSEKQKAIFSQYRLFENS
jgi:hypothetical protein